jgi:CubicO group peptidase (beta-lactamase class C family)
MSAAAFSPDGLAQLHDVLAGYVDRGEVPGLVALVAANGQSHVEVLGQQTLGEPSAMKRDSIFRIASLTKPITAAALLALVDDGVVRLGEPVDELLPELAARRVLRAPDGPLDDTVAANRPVLIDDLPSCLMGFGLMLAPPGSHPIQRAEADLGLMTMGPPWPPPEFGPDEWMARLGTLPLVHQPGEVWMYNTGLEVLGVLVARAAGCPLEQYLRDRLFDPLGMRSTWFHVPPEQTARFTTSYLPDPTTGELSVLDQAVGGWWSRPPALPNGAAWLVSTIDDFASFVSLFTGRGVVAGERVLSEASIDALLRDRLTTEQRSSSGPFFTGGSSWGFGMAVPAADGPADAPAWFGWDGGAGTTWRTDRRSGLTTVLFTQRAMISPEPPTLFTDFREAAVAALVA